MSFCGRWPNTGDHHFEANTNEIAALRFGASGSEIADLTYDSAGKDGAIREKLQSLADHCCLLAVSSRGKECDLGALEKLHVLGVTAILRFRGCAPDLWLGQIRHTAEASRNCCGTCAGGLVARLFGWSLVQQN